LKFADAEAGIFSKASITETSGYSVLLKKRNAFGHVCNYRSNLACRTAFLPTTGSIVRTEADTDWSFEIIGVSRTPSIAWRGSWNATLAAEAARDSSMIAGSIPCFLLS